MEAGFVVGGALYWNPGQGLNPISWVRKDAVQQWLGHPGRTSALVDYSTNFPRFTAAPLDPASRCENCESVTFSYDGGKVLWKAFRAAKVASGVTEQTGSVE